LSQSQSHRHVQTTFTMCLCQTALEGSAEESHPAEHQMRAYWLLSSSCAPHGKLASIWLWLWRWSARRLAGCPIIQGADSLSHATNAGC